MKDAIPISGELLTAAFHEAGHAVAAVLYGRKIRHATITPSIDDDGLPMLGYVLLCRNPVPRSARRRVRADLVFGLAGSAAERILLGNDDIWPCAEDANGDFDLCMECADWLTRQKPKEDEDAQAERAVDFYCEMMKWTVRLLRRPKTWKAVQAVAVELLRHGKLSGARVTRVIKAAMNTPLSQYRWAFATVPIAPSVAS